MTSGKAATRGQFFKVEKILLRTDKQENYTKMEKGMELFDETARILIENQALIRVRPSTVVASFLNSLKLAHNYRNSWQAR